MLTAFVLEREGGLATRAMRNTGRIVFIRGYDGRLIRVRDSKGDYTADFFLAGYELELRP